MPGLPSGIFEPEPYAPVGAVGGRAECLPPWCYTSAAWLARETERIFRRSWVVVGWHQRAASPGGYFSTEVTDIPVIVVRGRDHRLRAFANTCRHQGAKLLDSEGSCRSIKCPYHGWVYALDGRLTGAPDIDETREFDPADYGLQPIRLDVFEGFVFISFKDDAASLDAHVRGLAA